jgi:hypothetical protein
LSTAGWRSGDAELSSTAFCTSMITSAVAISFSLQIQIKFMLRPPR